MKQNELRVMIIGAHPDDPDITAGGLAYKFAQCGARVRLVAICNGSKGHMQMKSKEIAIRRYGEAQQAKEILGVEEYRIFPHEDCEIEVTLAQRMEMTRLIREFAPHLVFTHRICDYHVDHRTVGTLVMDTSYLLGVPLWCPDVPIPSVMPAIYFLSDAFRTPSELRPDILFSIDDVKDTILNAMNCHQSQFFEWLAFDKKIEHEIPSATDLPARKAFMEKYWLVPKKGFDAMRFRSRLEALYGKDEAAKIQYVEAFELSEYGYQPTPEELPNLFPFLKREVVLAGSSA